MNSAGWLVGWSASYHYLVCMFVALLLLLLPLLLLLSAQHLMRTDACFVSLLFCCCCWWCAEARAGAMGQYSHNNQPGHHLLYLFGLLNDRSSMETLVAQIMNRGYGPDFYLGDEDNGEMGAWFVLSALGLYDVAPGSAGGEYVLGTPVFKHVRVDLMDANAAGGTTAKTLIGTSAISRMIAHEHSSENHVSGGSRRRYLDIVGLGASSRSIHVQQVLLNGARVTGFTTTAANSAQLPGNTIRYSELMGVSGGHMDSLLQFVMSSEDATRPPVTKEQLDMYASGHLGLATALAKQKAKQTEALARLFSAEQQQKQQQQAPVVVPQQPPAVVPPPVSGDGGSAASLEEDKRIISNQELQIQQLQTQLASIRHHAIEAQQAAAVAEQGSVVDVIAAVAPVVAAEVANKVSGEAPPTPESGQAVTGAVHKLINSYPTAVVLLIWLSGTLALLCMVTAAVAYSYVLLLAMCCGVRVVPGVDPSKYISASPWAFCCNCLRGLGLSSLMGGVGDSGIPFMTPKKRSVHTV